MKNVSKISFTIKGIEVQLKNDSSEPFSSLKMSEMSQTIDIDKNIEISEMKQEQSVITEIPELIKNVCNVIHEQTDSFIATSNKINENIRKEELINIEHGKIVNEKRKEIYNT